LQKVIKGNMKSEKLSCFKLPARMWYKL